MLELLVEKHKTCHFNRLIRKDLMYVFPHFWSYTTKQTSYPNWIVDLCGGKEVPSNKMWQVPVIPYLDRKLLCTLSDFAIGILLCPSLDIIYMYTINAIRFSRSRNHFLSVRITNNILRFFSKFQASQLRHFIVTWYYTSDPRSLVDHVCGLQPCVSKLCCVGGDSCYIILHFNKKSLYLIKYKQLLSFKCIYHIVFNKIIYCSNVILVAK